MRKAVSVSFDQKQLSTIEMILSNKKYRNRSHFIEMAIDRLINEEVNSIRENN